MLVLRGKVIPASPRASRCKSMMNQCQSCGQTQPASPRASHYKGKEKESKELLSKLKFFRLFPFSLCIASLFASTPSWNRTSNSPLGGVCYIHLTMGADESRRNQPFSGKIHNIINISSIPLPYPVSPKEDPDHFCQNDRKQPSGYK